MLPIWSASSVRKPRPRKKSSRQSLYTLTANEGAELSFLFVSSVGLPVPSCERCSARGPIQVPGKEGQLLGSPGSH